MYHEKLPDLELCRRAQLGDSEALDCMVRRYSPLADKASSKSRIRGQTFDDLKSVATEALIKAVMAKKDKQPFASFATKCIRNQFASLVRTARRRPLLVQHTEKYADFEEIIIDPKSFAAYDGVETNCTVIDIRLALTQSENQVLDVLLARGGIESNSPDLEWREVAERLGQSRTTIYRIVETIRAKVREVLFA